MLLFCKFRINNCSDLSYGIYCECRKEHRNGTLIVLLHSRELSAFVYIAKEVEVVVVIIVVAATAMIIL
jgi:hypothetical protein